MIYTLNLSDNFADKLVEIVLNRQSNPLQTAQTQIILPTKRACRTVREAFIRLCGEKPILMPQIRALFETDDLMLDIPPALSRLERLFLLARLCQAKSNIDTLDKAFKIATALGEILDEFYIYEVSLDKLENLIPNEDLAQHWKESLVFLDVLRSVWPQVLAEKGKIDSADRTIRLINCLTKKIENPHFSTPVILAGFDGEVPAIRRLIKALNNKNNSLILLSGLNTEIDVDDMKNITAQHYQFHLHKLLKHLKTEPQNISLLSQNSVPQEALIHEAFKPAEQADEWRHSNISADVLQNVTRIDCDTITEEALTIALLLREVLETPEKTAALVTSDRNLSRHVIAQMKRWGIELDDSAGTPLHHTPTGVFLSLIADYGLNNGSGSSTLALLKHPLCADGSLPADLRKKAKQAEYNARSKHTKLDFIFQTDMSDFLRIFEQNDPVSFKRILTLHLEIAEKLANSSDRTGMRRLWETDDGEEAYRFFTELKEHAENIGSVLPSLYGETLTYLMSGISVRPKYGMHPRLDILGPIESRLIHPDVCIIGGLNEGTFPQLPDTGPWLSRPMRQKIGLPLPESSIAMQSMDFAYACCAKEVYLTRSLKADGSQTIPSRFLSRMEAVLEGADIKWQIQKPLWTHKLDMPDKIEKTERPAPIPPLELRPTQLSVTNIERLMCNPYGVYARYILKLYPLDELENMQDRLLYGSALHKALENMVKNNVYDVQTLVDDMMNELRCLNMPESSVALYRPKVEKVAQFISKTQEERINNIQTSFAEIEGEWTFKLEDKSDFTITAKADRIDYMQDGSIEIIDYKTGTPPSNTQVCQGYKPQLPLEGLIVKNAGFNDVLQTDNVSFSFWKLSGQGQGGEVKPVNKIKKQTISSDEIMDFADNGVKRVLNAYRDEKTPYIPYLKPTLIKYDDYEYLARVKEWLSDDDENNAGE